MVIARLYRMEPIHSGTHFIVILSPDQEILSVLSFSNVVLLKRTTFENLWKTSKRFLKGSRSPEVFERFFRGFRSTFFVYFRCQKIMPTASFLYRTSIAAVLTLHRYFFHPQIDCSTIPAQFQYCPSTRFHYYLQRILFVIPLLISGRASRDSILGCDRPVCLLLF